MSSERIQEYSAAPASMRVDRANNVVRGVKVLGLVSKNGREYTPAAIAQAAKLYEGAKVYFNHSTKPGQPRGYEDQFGRLKNITVKPDGLWGDLHYNPKHALAEQFLHDAAASPENCGLSHDVEATTSRRGSTILIESIKRVHSVDIVSQPATNNGLFESIGNNPAAVPPKVPTAPVAMTHDSWSALAESTEESRKRDTFTDLLPVALPAGPRDSLRMTETAATDGRNDSFGHLPRVQAKQPDSFDRLTEGR